MTADSFRKILAPLTSLRLTIIGLGFAILLVFFGTMEQVHIGIYGAQKKYFDSFFVLWSPDDGQHQLPVLPGGYLVGGMLLLNLLAAHAVRFKFIWKKSGILLLHLGVILLLVGQLLTSLLAKEGQMRLDLRQTKNYSESFQEKELAIIDPSDPKTDRVISIPEALLADGQVVTVPGLPFSLQATRYFRNALAVNKAQVTSSNIPTLPVGPQAVLVPIPPAADSQQPNTPAAELRVTDPDGASSTLIVSEQLAMPRSVTFGGKTWSLELRARRFYKPYALTLLEFTHKIYPGTSIPKDFSSKVTIADPATGENREALIYMNHPLRYRGVTFYQLAFDNNDTTSILQVVRNPGWLLPYIACSLVALGLIVQFSIHLFKFGSRKKDAETRRRGDAENAVLPASPRLRVSASQFVPLGFLVIGLLIVGAALLPPKAADDFDRAGFGALPVLVGGRVKPIDTLARTSLLSISGKQILRADGKVISACDWLMDVLMRPQIADQQPIFPLTNPDLRDLLGWRDDRTKLFSFNDLGPFLPRIEEQAKQAADLPAGARSAFQRELLKLRERLLLYIRLKNTIQMEDSDDFAQEIERFRAILGPGLQAMRAEEAGQTLDEQGKVAFAELLTFAQRHQRLAQTAYVSAIPRTSGDPTGHDWRHIGEALTGVIRGEPLDPAVWHYGQLIETYRNRDTTGFNGALLNYQDYLAKNYSAATPKIAFEMFYNHFQPFYQAMTLYVLVFILAWLSWLVWPAQLGRAAFWLLLLAFVVHTFGLVARMWLQGRPPVTNLYSSAIFVGWGITLLCIFLEKINRNGLGAIVAAGLGFVTLLIAHHLSVDGDTMEMLRAVLDTNLWLATHVVVVTLGYSATFLSGFLAVVCILRGVLTGSLTGPMFRQISVMVYGIVCFATLFSFVGTILGGIWADQSWGRFWGWDPKENGALLIVLWNAIILHARWGGLIRERGLMVLAVGGNIITSFSWFGVNMLGVGLHSYGFMDQAFQWLVGFDLSQLVLIALGLVPLKFWKSFAKPESQPLPPSVA